MKKRTAVVFAATVALVLATTTMATNDQPAIYGLKGSNRGPPDTVQEIAFEVPDLDAMEAALEQTAFRHPSIGDFRLQLTEDPDPVNVAMGWYDDDDTLQWDETREFVVDSADVPMLGRITATEHMLGGYLIVDGTALELSADWQKKSAIRVAGPEKGHRSIAAFDEPGETSDLQNTGGSVGDQDDCEQMQAQFDVTSFIVDCDEVADTVDIPVGDDSESASMGDSTGGKPVGYLVFVVHESKSSRATSDCSYANDRIFKEEAQEKLRCKHVDAGSRHDTTSADGGVDWDDFRSDYYAGSYSYKSSAEAYNGGRFVAFLPGETYLYDTDTAGGTYPCGPDWLTSDSSNNCGHFSAAAVTAAFHVHNSAYSEGLAFAHEMFHAIGIDAQDDVQGHDTEVAHKNYNGDEGCEDPGNDFVSYNNFFPAKSAASGGDCEHMHFWITTEVECYIQVYADTHAAHYPADTSNLL